MRFLRVFFLSLLVSVFFTIQSYANGKRNAVLQPSDTCSESWVDSVMSKLSLRERIGQLFMVAAYSNRDQSHVDEISELIRKEHIGGLIFFQGGPVRQAVQTNYYQSITDVPLLIGMDAEWGLGMRLDSTVSYPRQIALGASSDSNLVYRMAVDMSRQFKRMGVHVDFAPVVDVNSNYANPVINTRSFGENREVVANYGIEYVKGLQDNGIIACAKHFPGHGDTFQDSHYSLPLVNQDTERLDSVELYPFRELIRAGVKSVMVAHLRVPALEPDSLLPSSISKRIITDKLKGEFGFDGLVFTDAMNMKGIAALYDPIDANIKALQAGNDVLLFPSEVDETIDRLVKMVKNDELTDSFINEKCRKVLAAKYFAGLNHYKPIEFDNLVDDLNTQKSELICRDIARKSITLLQNKFDFIPVKRLDTLNIAYLGVGDGAVFEKFLDLYAPIAGFNIDADVSSIFLDSLLLQLDKFNLIIVGLHSIDSRYSNGYGVSNNVATFLFDLAFRKKVIVDIFGSPYAITRLYNPLSVQSIVVSYNNSVESQELSAQAIFGGIPTKGVLPVTSSIYSLGSGYSTLYQTRLSYVLPQELGVDSSLLLKVDSIAYDAIRKGATPGIQILAAKDGEVFLNKSYGKPLYFSHDSTNTNLLYDVASVTKVAATTPAIMKLVDMGSIDLNKTLSSYLNLSNYQDKSKITIKDLLWHQSGLAAWKPFYVNFLTTVIPGIPLKSDSISIDYPFRANGGYLSRFAMLNPRFFNDTQTVQFPNRCADGLYTSTDVVDSIYSAINSSELSNAGHYRYSDLGFIYLKRVVESVTLKPLDEFCNEDFYKPLGMDRTAFNPLRKFKRYEIAPTEYDIAFRKQLVWGNVHDPAAAIMGGVSGHAGLFSTANDLAKLMQMFLWDGEYGGERYFSPGVVKMFTSGTSNGNGNRRALGFDKPVLDGTPSPAGFSASTSSFGHTGFTGTVVWADPENGLVYIFLSNRVHPDAENNMLSKMDVRTKIHDVLYKAVSKENR